MNKFQLLYLNTYTNILVVAFLKNTRWLFEPKEKTWDWAYAVF